MRQVERLRQDEVVTWRGEPVDLEGHQGIQRYLDAIRRHWLAAAMMLILALAGGGAYIAVTPKEYQAQANLLVTPAPPDDTTALFTPGLVRGSSDPVQAAQTAASLAMSPAVANQVRAMLQRAPGVDDAVAGATVAPIGESNVLAITVTSDSPARAKAVADAIAQATIEVRTSELHASLDRAIAVLAPRVKTTRNGSTGAGSLTDTLARLEALRRTVDPTLSVESFAPVPASPTSPRQGITLLAAAIIGVILALVAALVRQSGDTRLWREEQLHELYGAPPILARLPLVRRGGRHATDAYRSLAASLGARLIEQGPPRSVVVTGTGPREGVTTTAAGLARTLAAGGSRVVLVSSDSSDASPTVRHSLWDVARGDVSAAEALAPAPNSDGSLRLLLGLESNAPEWAPEGISAPAVRAALDALRDEADWIVVDTAPLSGIVNALVLAEAADAVLLVGRMGVTSVPDIAETLDIVRRHDVPVTGYALVGVSSRGRVQRHGSSRSVGDRRPTTVS